MRILDPLAALLLTECTVSAAQSSQPSDLVPQASDQSGPYLGLEPGSGGESVRRPAEVIHDFRGASSRDQLDRTQ